MVKQNNTYNYIIAGGGMAGLSLAYYLLQSSLKEKSVLIIDQIPKEKNDRTWCFWEKQKGTFDDIVLKRWNDVWLKDKDSAVLLDLEEYQYKMIRSIDFYHFVLKEIDKQPNFQFYHSKVVGIKDADTDDKIRVDTTEGEFYAKEKVFDSTYVPVLDTTRYHCLYQHFMGWLIKTQEEVFEDTPTLFDFDVEQHNECRFIYILPYSRKMALVEFTVFSDNILEKTQYEAELKAYLQKKNIYNYTISEVEFGIIPMTDMPFVQQPSPNVIRIGTSAGYVKPSTGYCFQRTQLSLQKIVQQLEQNSLKSGVEFSAWKILLDSVLLRVLMQKEYPAKEIFIRLFNRNKPNAVLKFLDEDSSIFEDFRIMNALPIIVFTKAFFVVILGKIERLFRQNIYKKP